jgi:L-rhamnose mutarotase
MERAVFYLHLYPGTEAEYDRRHEAIWPRHAEAIRLSGIRTMTGFRRGTDVWYYVECEPDRDTAFAVHATIPVVAEWAASFATIIESIDGPDGSMLWYDEVFHSDSAVAGDATRGLFGLVVAPDRIAAYEALHADPWPDMVAALDAAGFRNYTGFRRGNHVVYYGEFVPDLETCMARMDDFEVNARWGAAFEGIITTIVDETGALITAREVFHQD